MRSFQQMPFVEPDKSPREWSIPLGLQADEEVYYDIPPVSHSVSSKLIQKDKAFQCPTTEHLPEFAFPTFFREICITTNSDEQKKKWQENAMEIAVRGGNERGASEYYFDRERKNSTGIDINYPRFDYAGATYRPIINADCWPGQMPIHMHLSGKHPAKGFEKWRFIQWKVTLPKLSNRCLAD